MPLEITLKPKLTYKLKLTPSMKLSLSLLKLPMHELKEYIKEEIEKNPLLEPIEDNYYKTNTPLTEEDEEKDEYLKSLISERPSLQEHLIRQLKLFAQSKEDLEIGEYIIGNINEDGYLTDSIEEIAKALGVDAAKLEKALSLIQGFDPIGIGARDLRECLLLQLKAKGNRGSLAWKIADGYLPSLEKKRFKHIAKMLKRPVEEIKEAMQDIARLEPKPGRSFNNEKAAPLIPDAALVKDKDGYKAVLNDEELPRIRFNAKYKQMLEKKNTPQDAKEYLKGRLKAARALIDAVERRKETIRGIVGVIAYHQKGFLDNGATYLKPMSISQIAKKVGKHKSTVSRAIANKYVNTPYGIFALRDFCLPSYAVKAKMKRLIENEDKEKPLSDQEISNRLKEEGLCLSRRTITKYRKNLKILPSKSRQGF